MRTVALISGGKDSCYNMLQCVGEGHEIVALANLRPKDKDEVDSYMYQSVGHHAIELYAEAMGLPLFRRTIEGASVSTGRDYQKVEADEVEDLYKLLTEIKEKIPFEAVSVGAVLSDYQRVRVENVCSRLGLTPLAYLWRRDQKELLDEMIQCGIKAILIKVATLGLSPDEHLGKTLTEMRNHLHKMNEKFSLNVCGEGGEYETFTLDCPLFDKEIVIDETETVIHSDDAFAPVGYLNIKKAHLKDKPRMPSKSQAECVQDLPMMSSSSLHRELFREEEEVKCPECEKLQWHPNMELSAVCTWTKKIVGDHIWISGITVKYEPGVSLETLVLQTMNQLRDHLISMQFDMSCLSLVHLYIQRMEDFSAINSVYKQFFSLNPAARVCVQACLPRSIAMKMDCYGCRNHDNRQTMHVQGLSHWAPANIGPYSQAVKIYNRLYVAGQIAMVPANLSIINGGIHPQCRLSLRHIDRVIQAISSACSMEDIITCVCYVIHPDFISTAREEWSRARHASRSFESTAKERTCSCTSRFFPFRVGSIVVSFSDLHSVSFLDSTLLKNWNSDKTPQCGVVYVVVPQLPKAALVEWQVLVCQKTDNTYKDYSSSDLENCMEAQVSCVCDGDSLISSVGTVCKQRNRQEKVDFVQQAVQLFFRCYKRVVRKAGIDWCDLPMLRLFYPYRMFVFYEVHQAVVSEADDLPVAVVPVYQLETDDMLLSACQ